MGTSITGGIRTREAEAPALKAGPFDHSGTVIDILLIYIVIPIVFILFYPISYNLYPISYNLYPITYIL